MALICGACENQHGRSARSVASVSPSLWHALLQFRALVAIPVAFLAARGVGSEWLGFLLGAGTAVRLLSAPFAGRLADVFGAFRLELALFAIAAAVASLLYLPAHYFWLLALVNLIQAAMLAPLVPLADALALSWSRSTTRGNSGAFEYGWVRGIGSAAKGSGLARQAAHIRPRTSARND